MTEGEYLSAMDCLRKSELSMQRRNYAFAHIYLMEAMRLLGEELDNELTASTSKESNHE
jgi:hypothetical protein